MNTRDQIIQMFRESIIVQSLLTLLVVGTACAMFLAPIFLPETTIQVPESLYVIVGTVLGYWFKTKDRYNSEQMAARLYSYEQNAARMCRELAQALDEQEVPMKDGP